MSDRRPLGRIRSTRPRANSGATPEPAEPGRHRRATPADADPPPLRVPRPRTSPEGGTTLIL